MSGPEGTPQVELPPAGTQGSTASECAGVRLGRPAPDFEAAAYIDGGFRNVKLSDYRGRWVVLLFYPGDFTFVCPTELATLVTRSPELEACDTAALPISTDSRYVHKAWAEGELSRLVDAPPPFPLLSDHGGVIGRTYGVYDDANGAELRGTFLIDPEGTVRALEVLPPEVGRSVDELLRELRALQHHQATGELLPAGWEPGSTTLQPAPELLGRLREVWQAEE